MNSRYFSGMCTKEWWSGLSAEVEARVRQRCIRQWQKQYSDHFVISFSSHDIFGLWSCIQGRPRMNGCLGVTVTRSMMTSRRMPLTLSWIDSVHWVMVPVPMGPPSMVLMFRGCCSGCKGTFSWRDVAWSMILAAAPESVSTGRTEATPECTIWACNANDFQWKKWVLTHCGVLWRGGGFLGCVRGGVGSSPCGAASDGMAWVPTIEA